MNFSDENFLTYLRKNYPYLYDIECKVREVNNRSGFGNPSFSFTIINKQVQRIEFIESDTKKYYSINEVRNS